MLGRGPQFITIGQRAISWDTGISIRQFTTSALSYLKGEEQALKVNRPFVI